MRVLARGTRNQRFQARTDFRQEPNIAALPQAGARSFIITFDVYVILDIFEKYDNKRPDPICLT